MFFEFNPKKNLYFYFRNNENGIGARVRQRNQRNRRAIQRQNRQNDANEH
jgi:hypothetical protein